MLKKSSRCLMRLKKSRKVTAREGWAEAFKKMAKEGDDKLLNPVVFELSPDAKDWKW